LRAHIEKFKGQSIHTEDWKAFLYEHFSDKKNLLDQVDWNGWLHTPGMPPVNLSFDRTLADEVTQLAQKLINENVESVDPIWLSFETQQKTELLSQLFEVCSILYII
jgi:leukotriene-A4 hydrolase